MRLLKNIVWDFLGVMFAVKNNNKYASNAMEKDDGIV
jgi:hypothetical protein